MLNKILYDALERAFGSVVIGNENTPGTFTPPRPQTYYGQRRDEYATMTHWGETYSVCCPSCRETRHRLCFSHRWGTNYRDGSKIIRFSKYLAYCYNEHCDLRPIIPQIILPPDYADIAIDGKIELKKKTLTDILEQEIVLPRPTLSLTDPALPVYVSNYLTSRNFDPGMLTSKYGIRFADRGAHWDNPNSPTPFIFYDPRLLIPVIQHRRLISWQARALIKTPDRYKYIFPPGAKKSMWLYNLDKALFHRDIIITEGVTNVWRIGDNAVALFGKSSSEYQLNLFKTIWNYDGKAIICLDEDTYENQQDILMATALLQDKAFPRGISILRLRNGDAADHTKARMLQLMQKAFELAVTEEDKLGSAILDEADVLDMPDTALIQASFEQELQPLITEQSIAAPPADPEEAPAEASYEDEEESDFYLDHELDEAF
jgi:hypothetical protein